ncbi:hypothetical protein Syun_001411 [Stephania yunnanensis]|uniref:Uncharacterized protein n=1 Tax=Stephania yunnanensis TaxID=152371 RepID=A0AAP0QAW0_9MAGN
MSRQGIGQSGREKSWLDERISSHEVRMAVVYREGLAVDVAHSEQISEDGN